MAPSRGFTALRYMRNFPPRFASRRFSNFIQIATDSSKKSQIYISRSLDPFVNLSIEHYLLQKTSAESTILFLYTNRPCIVLGRNQNPWLEVNLGLLKSSPLGVELVRRRSGGGTVFHDEGNVNYSVICPTSAFNRDKHAEMVVRALKKLGRENTRVNERHDIVMDSHGNGGEGATPLKISGSAYKLTRLRSLHHGTCLLSSPNLRQIGQYLRSLAKPFIKARGVESVSSPIANVEVSNSDFEQAVVSEFIDLYGPGSPVEVSNDLSEVPEIAKGLDEMRSLDWTYCQTPQFTFSSGELDDVQIEFTARSGAISECNIEFRGKPDATKAASEALVGQKLHEIRSWHTVFQSPGGPANKAAELMDTLLGGSQQVPFHTD